MKKSSQNISNQVQSEEPINFKSIEGKVFLKKGENIYIGGELIGDTMRSLLRDQARSVQTSNLFEILDATITNEAGNLALIQSANMEHIQYAKALHHWNHVLKNLVHALAK